MYKYILKRILIAIPVLIGITIIDYAIMCMAGSPLAMMQGPRVSEAALEAKRLRLAWINRYTCSILSGLDSCCTATSDIRSNHISRSAR